ncbi:cytochrome c oxidase assembly protein [Agrococcus sp. SCSIO52902]|uniref:cytochrome c oxidase assembly protein n=1 Tax=Agrococcus sp. SCSIO52902 TaxID=2933290 RepID=UPI001FF6D418|nr:cytochrome c oxidase assembly protein [Agrococcus sp. SCSIO52902]UOW02009.1 cytochrome c oxidase assembly protein [Agrococcus sp. SCSIO52902]
MSSSDAAWLPPPSLEQFLLPGSTGAPVLPVLAAIMAIAYAAGVTRLRRQRRHWPPLRTAWFLLGCGTLAAVTGTRIDAYGQLLFSVLMFQQLALMMVIAPLLALGSPGTLLLRATPRDGAGRAVLRVAVSGLRSRAARFALHPALVIPLMLLCFFGLYVGGAADALLQVDAGHILMEAAFLLVGLLITVPLVSSDPLPRRPSYPGRLFDIFLEMQVHAAFGLVMLFSSAPFVRHFATSAPAEWRVDPVHDQGVAGVLAWTFGELPLVTMLVVTLARWQRRDRSRAGAQQRRADQETEAYNAYLAQLRQRDLRGDGDPEA